MLRSILLISTSHCTSVTFFHSINPSKAFSQLRSVLWVWIGCQILFNTIPEVSQLAFYTISCKYLNFRRKYTINSV